MQKKECKESWQRQGIQARTVQCRISREFKMPSWRALLKYKRPCM